MGGKYEKPRCFHPGLPAGGRAAGRLRPCGQPAGVRRPNAGAGIACPGADRAAAGPVRLPGLCPGHGRCRRPRRYRSRLHRRRRLPAKRLCAGGGAVPRGCRRRCDGLRRCGGGSGAHRRGRAGRPLPLCGPDRFAGGGLCLLRRRGRGAAVADPLGGGAGHDAAAPGDDRLRGGVRRRLLHGRRLRAGAGAAGQLPAPAGGGIRRGQQLPQLGHHPALAGCRQPARAGDGLLSVRLCVWPRAGTFRRRRQRRMGWGSAGRAGAGRFQHYTVFPPGPLCRGL